mgnify:FL=1
MKKILNFLKNNIYIFFYIAIVLIITGTFLFSKGYLFLTDYTSGPLVKYGNDIVGLFSKFLMLFLKTDLTQKVVVFFSYLTVIFGAKKVVENFIDNKYLVFVVSLFALFNPYVYERTGYGQFGVIFAYGFLLFVFGFILKFVLNYKKENKFKDNISIVFAALCSGLAISSSAHFVFFIVVPWLIVLFFVIKRFKDIDKKQLFTYLGITVIIVCALNYSLIAGVFSKNTNTAAGFTETSISHQDLLAFATSDTSALCINRFDGDCDYSSFGIFKKDAGGNEELVFNKDNKSFDAFYNVLSMSGFWGKDQVRFHDLTDDRFIFNFSFFIVFALAIYGLIKSKEYFKVRKLEYIHKILWISFIVVVILAVGVRSNMFRWLTLFLFDHLPFYSGLREQQKWVSVLCCIYLVFISIAVKYIYENYKIRNNRKNQILVAAILAIVFILRAPYTLFGFSGQIVPIEYPQDWYQIDKILWEDENKCDNGKVLFLPWHLYMHFPFMGSITFNGQVIGNRIVSNPAPIFFRCPTIYGTNMEWGGIYDNVYDANDIAVQNWFESNLTDIQYIKDIGAKYILLAKAVDYQDFATALYSVDYTQLITENDNFYLWKIK